MGASLGALCSARERVECAAAATVLRVLVVVRRVALRHFRVFVVAGRDGGSVALQLVAAVAQAVAVGEGAWARHTLGSDGGKTARTWNVDAEMHGARRLGGGVGDVRRNIWLEDGHVSALLAGFLGFAFLLFCACFLAVEDGFALRDQRGVGVLQIHHVDFDVCDQFVGFEGTFLVTVCLSVFC